MHAQACAADGRVSVMLWHYRIDDTHSNAHTAWLQMGSPQAPSPDQYAALERASELTLLESPRWLRSANGQVTVEVVLPRQSVSLLQFEADRI